MNIYKQKKVKIGKNQTVLHYVCYNDTKQLNSSVSLNKVI